MIDRRHELRFPTDVELVVWGVDIHGECFMQPVRARDISLSGALLSGLDTDLQSGDLIGIVYAGKKARFRVVWVRYDGDGERLQIAVHRLAADACPWPDLISEPAPLGPTLIQTQADAEA